MAFNHGENCLDFFLIRWSLRVETVHLYKSEKCASRWKKYILYLVFINFRVSRSFWFFGVRLVKTKILGNCLHNQKPLYILKKYVSGPVLKFRDPPGQKIHTIIFRSKTISNSKSTIEIWYWVYETLFWRFSPHYRYFWPLPGHQKFTHFYIKSSYCGF